MHGRSPWRSISHPHTLEVSSPVLRTRRQPKNPRRAALRRSKAGRSDAKGRARGLATRCHARKTLRRIFPSHTLAPVCSAFTPLLPPIVPSSTATLRVPRPMAHGIPALGSVSAA